MKTKVFEIHDLKRESDGDKHYMSGYANTKGVQDSHGHIPTSYNGQPVYDLSRLNSNPVCFVDHNNSASNIAGNFVELKEDDKGLFFKLLFRSVGKIYNDLVKDAVQAYVDGFGRALSIGGNWLFEDMDNPSNLTKALIFEMSLVGVGSDGNALGDIPYPKSLNKDSKEVIPYKDLPLADRTLTWDYEAAKKRVQEWAGGADGLDTEAIQNKYKSCFLFYDSKKPESLSSYKFPIADIIDGKLTAIPRGIFAAAMAINGIKSDVDILESDKSSVIANIDKHYDKMGLKSPFGESFRIDSFKNLSEKSLEDMFKTGVRFSQKTSKTMVSIVKSLRDAEDSGQRDADSLEKIFNQLKNMEV